MEQQKTTPQKNYSHQADLAFFRELMKIPMLTRQKEREYAMAWHLHKDEKALHALTTPHMRLVVSIALRFRHHGLPLNDLIQEGNVGLMQAADRFDPNRDIRFSVYAKWWIRSHIQNFVLRNWSIVRTGSTLAQKQLFFNLRRLRAQIDTVASHVMSNEDRQKIAQELKVQFKDVIDMENRLAARDLSLSIPAYGLDAEDWGETIPDDRDTPEHEVLQKSNSSALQQCLKTIMFCLNKREKQIINSRHLSESPSTLSSLSEELNISKERIRQLENKALRKMRYHMRHNIHNAKDILYD